MVKFSSTADLQAYREELTAGRDEERPVIAICAGTGCKAYGSAKLIDALICEHGVIRPVTRVRIGEILGAPP